MNPLRWWQKGVIYQIYPRSFYDTNQDGIGDLQGIIDKLDYLNNGTEQSLGIDTIWISPFYPSPMADFGYDVAEYCDVDPVFGDLATFDRLVEAAHQRGIKIVIDYVPNHTSSQHPWFQESRTSRDNPKHDWYIWRDLQPDGSLPNNWGSVFGGPAWTWDETRQQVYFHQFDPGQPDLNWRNPAVKQAMLEALRFWMRRGVDGFRMDVIYMIWKHPDLPDQPLQPGAVGRGKDDLFSPQQQIYAMNYAGIHDIMREIRATLDEFGDTFSVGEVWLPLEERIKYYGQNNDELHLPFNFDLISDALFHGEHGWSAEGVRRLVDTYEAAIAGKDWWPNYVLGNHDIRRLASRIGSAQTRAAAMLLLTLRGTPTIYMGDEIGMIDGEITEQDIQDPQGIRLGLAHTRDFCRTPMQWNEGLYGGFSTVKPWLPVHSNTASVNTAAQDADEHSLLNLYRRLIWYRKDSPALLTGSYRVLDLSEKCYVYLREAENQRCMILLNFTHEPQQVMLKEAGKIALSTHLDRSGQVEGEITLRPDEGLLIELS